MKDGFIRVASSSFEVKVGDIIHNRDKILDLMKEADEKNVKLLVFPELSITGCTCFDLFLDNLLIEKSEEALIFLLKKSEVMDGVFIVGFPISFNDKLYNCAAIFTKGKLLGIVPKLNIKRDSVYERYFDFGFKEVKKINYANQETYIGSLQIFSCQNFNLKIGIELGEDAVVIDTPSNYLSRMGANIICNLSASSEIVSKSYDRKNLIRFRSKNIIASYLYASAGIGESTGDNVYSGHSIIAVNGEILKEKRFLDGLIYTEIDVMAISSLRKKNTLFNKIFDERLTVTKFNLKIENTKLSFKLNRVPFLKSERSEIAYPFYKDSFKTDYLSNALYFKDEVTDIIEILSRGLIKRLKHTGIDKMVIGVSGGLDSTIALIIACRVCDILSIDRKNIFAITMPGFGTSDRTHNNANNLMDILKVTKLSISIVNAVKVHFNDIGQSLDQKDVTYENSQARERTQILMDYANKVGAIVLGTGDLSEMVLGFTTYNGDHMSMYGINSGITKTLIRVVLKYIGEKDGALQKVLFDIIDTPVSPELVKEDTDKISQKTEDIIGPYELNDFFTYYMLKYNFSPKKIYRLALDAFYPDIDEIKIKDYLKNFYHRFFISQFKRSCVPDGVKVLDISLSPRGGLMMPSDMCTALWKKEIDEI